MKQFQTEVKISVITYQFYQVFIKRYFESVQFLDCIHQDHETVFQDHETSI